MLLSHETSSIAYDKVDLFYGKFVPAHTLVAGMHVKGNLSIRIFCNITGLFSDLSGRFAEKYDGYALPLIKNSDGSPSGVIDFEMIMKTISKSAIEAIMEEKDFWRLLQPYPWYMLLFQEIYNVCGGRYYFMLHFFNALQLEDRLTWCARHFGAESRKKTIVLEVATMPLLVRSRNDILLDADLRHIEVWCDAGGSGFWWPELYGKCLDPAVILSRRMKLFKQAVMDLKALS